MTGLQRGFCLVDTALGQVGLGWTEQGLARLQLPADSPTATAARLRTFGPEPTDPPPQLASAVDRLRRYAEGAPIDFGDLELDLRGSVPFHRTVFAVLRQVRWGQTTTYGELAALTGAVGAAREVGVAMARNPVPVIVPCHRVLAAGGQPGGFSAPGGLTTKARLLALEGIRLDGGQPRLPGID